MRGSSSAKMDCELLNCGVDLKYDVLPNSFSRLPFYPANEFRPNVLTRSMRSQHGSRKGCAKARCDK